jgi:hypothetical protein
MDTTVLAAIVTVLAIAVIVIGAAGAAVWMRRRNARRVAPRMSPTSEDRTFVGIGARPPTSDATMVGTAVPRPATPRSDATVVDVARPDRPRVPAPAPEAPTVVMDASRDETATMPTVRVPKLRARVTVTKGGSGMHELEAREYTIGRSTRCEIVLVDDSVSGHHAKLAPRGDAFAVSDLGSTNGTTVDGRAVQGEHVLRGGETIGVGDARLRYERLA